MTAPLTAPTAAPPLVFTVAITGHQDIAADAHPALIGQIGTVLSLAARHLDREKVRNPIDAPREVTLRFLSALAPGADQIGARAAILPESAGAGWRLEAILPFETGVCKQLARAALTKRNAERKARRAPQLAPADITAGVDGIAELAGKAGRVLTLADWQPSGDARADEDWQARRYATIGQMLVRRADLLIALWDGTPPRGRGGTADVVTEALRSGVPVVWIDPAKPASSVSLLPRTDGAPMAASDMVRLWSPPAPARDKTAPVCDKACQAIDLAVGQVLLGNDDARAICITRYLNEKPPEQWIESHAPGENPPDPVPGDTHRAYARMLYWVLQYPKAALRQLTKAQRKAGKIATELRTNPFRHARPATGGWYRSALLYGFWFGVKRGDAGTANAAPLLDYAAQADALATRLSNQYRSAYVWIFLLAPPAVTCAVLSALLMFDFPKSKPILVLIELGVVLLATAIFMTNRANDPADRHSRRRGSGWLHAQDTHQRWLDARLIAESQRSGQLLAWAGFSGRRPLEAAALEDHEEHHDHSHGAGHAPPRTVWAPHFANAIAALPELPIDEVGHGPATAMTPARIAAVARAARTVIDDQMVYHELNHQRLEALNHRLDTISLRAIQWAAGFSLAFLVLWTAYAAGLIEPHSPAYLLKDAVGYVAAFAGAVLPAVAAAAAGIRFQGDFERFAMRSKDTADRLKALAKRAAQLEQRAADCDPNPCKGQPPLFEPLLDLLLDTQGMLDEDLADWRFAYAARPITLG
ncbi:hypothetical protein [Erythrobacter oryzae]|uniref:hypothetical protein n=1 Tax=Erythrobacter oryzae TaxID=3019556 RepID=UPI0025530262|nr:hypothetical protein [Erythrobacter sp. COR-2]